jgi:ACS family D-galactonate transporter-like MFS transporter
LLPCSPCVRHFTILKAGSLTAIPYLVFGLSEPAGGWIADHLIRVGYNETRIRKTVVAVAFLAGLMMGPAMMVKDGKLALALIAASSLVGLSTANVTVILQSCAPQRQVGVWTGVEKFAGNLGGVIAPVLMGVLIARTGSYTPGFIVACMLLVLGAGAYCFIVQDLNPHGVGRS